MSAPAGQFVQALCRIVAVALALALNAISGSTVVVVEPVVLDTGFEAPDCPPGLVGCVVEVPAVDGAAVEVAVAGVELVAFVGDCPKTRQATKSTVTKITLIFMIGCFSGPALSSL
jgi:hypothetical protein